ncbi:enoyl-CoA hydratase/isomerase [Hyaloraphidium curvatum]|nr:enoyl-CoA hydratase/isomerase [Hyaloraphidium curvatum]
MAPLVLVEKDGPITIVTINRPEAKNAVNRPTAQALADAFRDFDRDESSSVAILTGAGGTFCAGADLRAVLSNDPQLMNRMETDMLADGPMGPTRMVLSKPVIAAVEGFAVAGGLELACWTDLRVAAEDSVFGVFCRSKGVPLVDGGTVRLPRLIGMSAAMDLILTGRDVPAKEAKAMNLVNRLAPKGQALAEAKKLAALLASHPQTCMRNDRRSAYAAEGRSEGDALREEFALGLASLRTADQQGAISSFFSEKKKGEIWTGGSKL